MIDTLINDGNIGNNQNSFWDTDIPVLIITILSFLILTWFNYLIIKRERKKFINTFKGGKWFKASRLSYIQFKQGRPYSDYLHRTEVENTVIEAIRNKKHIILTGRPLRGKTRTMVECLKQLKRTSVLLPYPADYNNEIVFPKKHLLNGKNRIVVFDDLQKFFEPGKDPRKLIDKIIDNDWLIVSTCRTFEEWKTVQRIWGISLNILDPIEIPEVNKIIAQEAAILNGIELPLHFDGKNIGTVFVDLDEMRLQYNSKITPFQKQILLAIKKLFAIGKYNTKGEITLSTIKILSNIKQSDSQWLKDMATIIEKGFVSGNPYNIIPEQVYFDLIVEPQLSFSEIIRDINNTFPNEEINYHKLIFAASNQKAYNIIQALKQANINPDVYQYNMLIAKQESFEQGKALISEMKNEDLKPDVITYNTLMRVCKDFEQGKALISEMKKEDLKPNVITYSTLMRVCKDFEQGKALISEMKNEDLKPDVITYSTLMRVCKDFEQGKALISEMKNEDLKPDVITYNTLMRVCKDFEQGKALISEMKNEDLKPDVITYSTLMTVCKDFEQGKALISEMKNEDLKPDVITYSKLLEKVETEDDFTSWITEFCSTDLTPNVYILNGLKNIFPILYNSSKLSEIFITLLRFNARTFFSWIGYFKIADVNNFINSFPIEAIDTDFKKLGFANYYIQKGELESAKKLMDMVEIKNYSFFKYSGNYWFQFSDFDKAIDCYENALLISENDIQRSRICDMMAFAIKESNSEDKIEKGVEYCKQSFIYFPGGSSNARQLLTYFTLNFCLIDQIPQRLQGLRHDFNIGRGTIKKIINEINDEERKELILNIMQTKFNEN
ncbi:MAG: hypothetical protein WC319_06205 [Candidatus Paceibacterota bacterium]